MLGLFTPKDPHRQASHEGLRRVGKLATLIRYPAFRRALAFRTAAAVEHLDLPLVENARTVIDVGAHKGQFALLARYRFPDASLHCFEPLSEPRQRLVRTMGNDPQLQVHPVAAAEEAGAASMHVSKLDDSSSLLPIGDRYVASFPGTEEARTAEVTRERIDGVLDANTLERPILMKVDVQGAELEALIGAGSVLGVTDQVLVEVSFMELYEGQALAGGIVSYLDAQGFELSGCFNIKCNRLGQCIQADFLFDRRSNE